MSENIPFTLDGKEIAGRPGQTIMEAADAHGIYIPRLCAKEGLAPHGSCRVCTVLVNGRPQAACIQPVVKDSVVENNTPKVNAYRRDLIEMLFVEGNHFCMFCEMSGNCELQAVAYRLGIMAPKYPYLWPVCEMDASHPDVLIERNRCILCARCIRASRDLDGKNVFEFIGRGNRKEISVNAPACLADTNIAATDKAVSACPVGALLRKRTGYRTPIGKRLYDHRPIGSDIEAKNPPANQ